MNRHHPYGGSFDNGPPGRGRSPGGPDRPFRHQERGGFRGGGRGGFRGGRGGGGGAPGYSSYDGSGMSHGYDQGNQQPYADYEVQHAPDTYYQPNDYGNPPPFNDSAGYGDYNQKYEDPSGPGYDNNDYNRRRPPRKERDDKVHDSIIEERIQRERPCRTLFIRNIKYETPSDEVRRLFEEHGEIKTFFDLIATRGMVFVTYFDLRSAERARDRLQGSEISGRPIDVHYSLPRDDKGGENQRNQQFQGTLQVTLRASPSGAPIDDNEVRRRFQSFGDIKTIRPVNERIDSRYIEFYDTRAAEEAFERLKQSPLQDGVMDIVLAWDNTENQFRDGQGPGGGGHGRGWDDRGHRGGGGNRGRHGRGRGRSGRGGYNNMGDDYDRDEGYGGGRNRRFDNDYGRGGGGRDGPPGGYNDRYDNRGGYGGPPGPPPYGGGVPPPGPPPAPGPYALPPGPPPVAPPAGLIPGERLDQARKVQQLLAALKQPTGATSGTATPPMAPPAAGPPGGAPYYPPANMGYPAPAAYPGAPAAGAGANGTATPPVNPGLGNLPPNIMMLLQSQQGMRGGGASPAGPGYGPGQYPPPMMPPYMGQPPKP